MIGGWVYLKQISEEVVTEVLRCNKDEDLASLIELPKNLQEAQEAICLRSDFNELCDVLVHH